jgi:predicted small secreted protein
MEDYKMKKIIALALTLVLALSLAACGGNSDNGGGSTTTPPAQTAGNSSQTTEQPADNGDKAPTFTAGEWPDNDWTKQVPKPTAGTVGKVSTMGDGDKTLSVAMDWTREEAAAYCDELAAGKFNQNVLAYYKDSTSMSVLLEAESSDGWEVAVSETEIRIYKP